MKLPYVIIAFLLWIGCPDTYGQSKVPEHLILTTYDDPSRSQAITWRTSAPVDNPVVEIIKATAAPYDTVGLRSIKANSQEVMAKEGQMYYYHSSKIGHLSPGMLYRYRVGTASGPWGPWNQFQTVSNEAPTLEFIYLGDIQNDILSWGTRTVWAGHRKAPSADFMLFAGDCVDNGHNNGQWTEWFGALGRVGETMNIVPVTGNHEYDRMEDDRDEKTLSTFWQPQFVLPENGVGHLSESVFFIDYPAMRLIVLNSMVALSSEKELKLQTAWLEKTLAENNKKWTVVTFHHPLFSARDGRYGDYPALRKYWKPLFEKYQVDLVLTGHDHMYGRSAHQMESNNLGKNETGPVYVVSVAGPKMYGMKEEKRWTDRAGVNTQLYQVISIVADQLAYRAYTVTDKLYDSFDLIKQKERFNRIEEHIPFDLRSENRFPDGRYTNKNR
ncbi:metallophosphoesterase [Echinicola strongylocentroti]|uniref:Metallophosphoesterase n=1 Tax=Echinicola strongylocentroti TaxID=1795355 RepID=A0A2Z4IEH4_9BACT|nr:metallophosphoesterase family protein [Echinicola strongylocentroti]AWW28833.1 metallophosphoesterase [Echinicola strongylocentroti]